MAFLDAMLLLLALLLPLSKILTDLLLRLIWRPYAITKSFKDQGIAGPPYRFFFGSIGEMKKMSAAARDLVLDVHSHDITVKAMPEYREWTSRFGETFLYWFGAQPRICISDPELVKQVLANKFGFYAKTDPTPDILALLGRGLVMTEGSDWVRHRRVLNPAFAMDKLKLLTIEMAECTKAMLQAWEEHVKDEGKETEVYKEFAELTADIISHTAFGSSFAEGKEVFLAQGELQQIVQGSRLKLNIPGSKYLPTESNMHRWKLERTVRNKLMGIIKGRLNSSTDYGNDLLGLMIEASKKEGDAMLTIDEIIDECKTFFFAGHETTATLLAWAIFLLSIYPTWQEKLREEVLGECGMDTPTADSLFKLKLVNMVLLETLRLYCPVVYLERKAAKDMELKDLKIPKDSTLVIPVAMIHRSKKFWGEDADEFNPMRFENGVSKAAKHPNALLGFSIGPRSCIGQNFAMLEAKMAMAMILQKFSFSLSPNYKHSPMPSVTLRPQYGIPVVLKHRHADVVG